MNKFNFTKIILLTIPIIVILIGFNGYLNPNQTRVFGDTYPESIDANFEFFRNDFVETLLPSYFAPFRFGVDYIKTVLGNYITVDQVYWAIYFLPFLISSYLSYFFFFEITRRTGYGILVWLLYQFSTFVLFTSSIHTHIITGINLFLFFLFMFTIFIKKKRNTLDTLIYIILSTLILVASFTFEMRMVLVTMPFFFVSLIVQIRSNWETFTQRYSLIGILIVHLCIFFLVVGSFIYLVLNFSTTINQVSALTSRITWGNNYFSIINTLSLSHPFWNGGIPINFIYNAPSLVLLINVILTGVALFLLFPKKDNKKDIRIIMVIPLLFFLLLSKQNNPPFANIFDFLYAFPYFNFSREASKYYYGYILSLACITSYVFIKKRIKYSLKMFLIVLILIPSINNFYTFASHKFGKTTVAYSQDTNVYHEVNNYFLSRGLSARVMWLPYKSTLESDTSNIKHVGFNILANLYPLQNVRKESRSFLPETLVDPNFKDYLHLLNIDYVVIPNFENEIEMERDMQIAYRDFNFDKFRNYSINSLGLKEEADVSGYKIYKMPESENLPRLVNSSINQKHGNVNDIRLNNEITGIGGSLDKVEKYSFIPSNCNNDKEKGLNFTPEQRIGIKNNASEFEVSMFSHYEEVPCVFISYMPLPGKYIFLDVAKYIGHSIEMVQFSGSFNNVTSIDVLNETSSGLIPLECQTTTCFLGLYLYGDNRVKKESTTITATIVFSEDELVNSTEGKIYKSNTFINSFIETNIELSEQAVGADFLMLSYPYSPGYKLKINETERASAINSSGILMFDIKGINNTDIVKLFYEPEIKIQKTLLASKIITLTYIILLVLLLVFKVTKIIKEKHSKKESEILEKISIMSQENASAARLMRK